MEDSSEETERFDLPDFLEQNSDLFVVMGVFAALSVYLSQSSTPAVVKAHQYIRGGYVATLLITCLISVLIFKKMVNRLGGLDQLLQAHAKAKNFDLLIFSTMFLILIQSFLFLAVRMDLIIFQLLNISGAYLALILILVAFIKLRRIPLTQSGFILANWPLSVSLFWGGAYVLNHLSEKAPIIPPEQFELLGFWRIWPNALRTFFAMIFVMGGIMLVLTAGFSILFLLSDETHESIIAEES